MLRIYLPSLAPSASFLLVTSVKSLIILSSLLSYSIFKQHLIDLILGFLVIVFVFVLSLHIIQLFDFGFLLHLCPKDQFLAALFFHDSLPLPWFFIVLKFADQVQWTLLLV